MMKQPQFSIAFQSDKSLADYGPLAAAAEDSGFDGVSVYNDMLFQPCWLPLLEIARNTRRIRIGPAAVNPFTSHPVDIAGNIALLDEAANGRAYLGMARGAWLDYIGLRPQRPATALREALACVRHLLSGSTVPFEGNIFSLAGGDSLRWHNVRADIPFLLGSWGPQTIKACLPLVSEVKLGGTASPKAVRWIKSLVGNDPVDVVIGSVTVVADDGAAARALARREVALYLPVVAELDRSTEIEPDRLRAIRSAAGRHDYEEAARYISDDLLRLYAFAGRPEDVVEQTLELISSGAQRVEYGTPHGLSEKQGLKLLGESVLPFVRGRN